MTPSGGGLGGLLGLLGGAQGEETRGENLLGSLQITMIHTVILEPLLEMRTSLCTVELQPPEMRTFLYTVEPLYSNTLK